MDWLTVGALNVEPLLPNRAAEVVVRDACGLSVELRLLAECRQRQALLIGGTMVDVRKMTGMFNGGWLKAGCRGSTEDISVHDMANPCTTVFPSILRPKAAVGSHGDVLADFCSMVVELLGHADIRS
ncbi:72 kDa inositol polyphosphate 5-phosphatase [Striga asiatica]|uniref:72 kDa inositol polyphosphate 5-phosphatase n=1 Tax=Striga asiatica TaxID=4170 RepID=A0A5A7PMU8_STRAF|nr:72 kDa inositol polyphosphate 5-phosphatase [Striga asiatica]